MALDFGAPAHFLGGPCTAHSSAFLCQSVSLALIFRDPANGTGLLHIPGRLGSLHPSEPLPSSAGDLLKLSSNGSHLPSRGASAWPPCLVLVPWPFLGGTAIPGGLSRQEHVSAQRNLCALGLFKDCVPLQWFVEWEDNRFQCLWKK